MKTTKKSREYKYMFNSAVTCKLRLGYIIVYQKVIIKSNTNFLEIVILHILF